jgi:thioredoxin-dependent peroxiredoxin
MQKVCPLNENDSAPEFSTTDSEGNPVSQKKLLGKKYLLYFYPRDNTPGCTAQACGFKNHYDFFKDKSIEIYGVSGDSAKSHQKFIDKFQLPFPLLLDEYHKIAKAFGVWGEKKFMGRTFEGIHRITFLIGESGKIERSFTKVKAKSHPDELVKEL